MVLVDGIFSQKKKAKKIAWNWNWPAKKTLNYHKPNKFVDGLARFADMPAKFSIKRFFHHNLWIPKLAAVLVIFIIIFSSVNALSSTDLVSEKFDIYKLFKNGKFLILFQNNAELRPTGGFIGSIAVADLDYGKIKNVYIDTNIYKRDDKFGYMLQKKAPDPLQTFLIDKFWTLHDANWAIDFRDSARQAMWFYKNEGGEDVDGVIAINASAVQDLLKITGPMEIPEASTVIDSNNFFSVLHQEVEKDYYLTDEENRQKDEPKAIISNLAKKLMDEVKQKKYYSEMASYLIKQLNSKQILLYFNNPTLENLAIAKNWTGDVKNTDVDYLYVNNANLGGFKSSMNIKQNMELDTLINDKNEVIDTLTVTRVHTGTGQWPDAENKNYLRILVPKGSTILNAELDKENITGSIEIKEESQKTSFGLWVNTPIGNTRILKISYELPFYLKNKKYYSLYLQKQPGVIDEEAKVIINGNVKFSGQTPADLLIKY